MTERKLRSVHKNKQIEMKILCLLSFITGAFASCELTKVRATCSGINSANFHQEMSTIPVSSDRYEYMFRNSSIENFPVNAFSALKKANVLYLYINNSQIETIQTGAFSGLLEIREIYLQFNALKVVSQGCFNSLPKLKILDLSNNNVNLIESGAFNGSNEMRKIFLNNNNLTTVPPFLFHPLKRLQVVDLSNNSVEKFDLSFTNYAVYKEISLSNNKITDINCQIVRDSSLDVIKLDNNQLTEIDASCLPIISEELVLNKNNLIKIDNLTQLTSLKFLDLSDNHLSNLDTETFKDMKKLQHLNLQKNNLGRIAPGLFKDLPSLVLLNLSANFIELLDFGVFNGLENLQNLDLSYNQLELLEEDVFHNLYNLEALNVSYNKLQDINLEKLKSFSKPLRKIDLIGNRISCQKLSSMVTYERIIIIKNVFHNVSNVKGIPCKYFNILQNNETTLPSDNVFKEIRAFFNTDFKNTSFFKFFSRVDERDNQNRVLLNNDQFGQLLAQVSKNNVIFIIFTITVFLLNGLLFAGILLLIRFFVFRPIFPREQEMNLL